jgi:hypothetical protein
MSYESITSVDPVLAIKRDHPEAPRLRFASDISKYIKKCVTTHDRLAEIKRRGAAIGNETLDGALSVITPSMAMRLPSANYGRIKRPRQWYSVAGWLPI